MSRKAPEKERETRLAYLEGWASISLNILLFAGKYVVGTTSGSVAIIADAWHTLSDSISSLLVLIGVKWSRKPADADHPYGHGRADAIASLVIGVLLVLVAVFFGRDSIERLLDQERARYGFWAVAVTLLSIAGKEVLARFSLWASQRCSCASLRADAWHHRSDALSSGVILVGIAAARFFPAAWWMDGVLGLLVCLFILKAAIEIFREVLGPLLGEAPSPRLVAEVESICRRVCGDTCRPHHFHVHDYGRHTELTFHILLPGETTLAAGHATASRLEAAVKGELGVDATIHLEPESEHLRR